MKSLTGLSVRTWDAPDHWPDEEALPAIDRVRVWKDDYGDGDPTPWHLDGYVMTFGENGPADDRKVSAYAVLSPGVWDFETFSEAIAAIPEFIERRGAPA